MQNGGDFMWLPEFWLCFKEVLLQVCKLEVCWYMVAALTVYAGVCLFWSLALDD